MEKTDVKKDSKKMITAKVVSTKMNKTVIVEIVVTSRHPLYRKAVHKTKRFAAHVDGVDVVVGDMVQLVEIKPMSKTKHFMVTQKVTK